MQRPLKRRRESLNQTLLHILGIRAETVIYGGRAPPQPRLGLKASDGEQVVDERSNNMSDPSLPLTL